MTAIRSAGSAEGKFVQISNALIRDEELSVLARFIVCYVLSLPPDHPFTAEWLEGRLPGYGTRSVRAALGELKAHGHMKVTRRSRGRGIWEWEQVISDGPLDDFSGEQLRTDETTCGNASAQVSSSVQVSPDDGSSDDGRSDKELNTEQPKHEDQNQAPRRARALRDTGATGIPAIADDVRQAAAIAFGDKAAARLTDDDCARLHAKFCCSPDGSPRKIRSVRRYLLDGPFKDIPDIETALKPRRRRETVPFDVQVRYDDLWTADSERLAIVEEIVGMYGPGEEPAVESMIGRKMPLRYILDALESGNLFTAA